VLAADGIAHRVAVDAGVWWIFVDEADFARARTQIALWQNENPQRAPAAPAPEPRVDTSLGYGLALALVVFFAITGPWSDTSEWFERGNADARRIVRGELWRTVTALTLHSDISHVLGNAFSCAVFATLVLRRYGPGTGVWLLLLSGALGNLATALWHGAFHRSVGASTALFGAIGVLAGTELVRRRRRDVHWRQAWLPLAGGLGLLAMLGTGRGSDLAAHVFGLLAGIGVGLAAARAASVPLPTGKQRALAAGALAVGVAAWLWAFADRVSAWL
jgi:membrane associated rhomboid family serine protease